MHRRISTTFRFNIKYSFIKLLCTLTRLCRGTPLQPLRLEFFGINFPSHPCSHNFHCSHFFEQKKWGKGASHISTLRSPTFTPQLSPPPQLPRTFLQGHIHAALHHSASSFASGGTFPLHFKKYFLRALTLLFLRYLYNLSWSLYPLGSVT